MAEPQTWQETCAATNSDISSENEETASSVDSAYTDNKSVQSS